MIAGDIRRGAGRSADQPAVLLCAGVRKEYDSCAVRTPRGEYEAKVASYSIFPSATC